MLFGVRYVLVIGIEIKLNRQIDQTMDWTDFALN